MGCVHISMGACLNVNNILVYLWDENFTLESIVKQILLLPIYIFSVGLRREDIWQLYLLPLDSPKPRHCREERIDLDMCFVLFSALL